MKFCHFVPPAARSYILEMIHGEPSKWDGLERLANKAKKQFDEFLEKKQEKLNQSNKLSDEELQEERRAKAHYEQRLGDLEAVQRLGTDLQMEPAYKALHKKFREDEQLCRFLHAAWSARINFLRHREALDRAKILSKAIAADAEHLSSKIRDLFKTFHDTPLELHSISELLRQTDNRQLDARNLEMWRIYRSIILGDKRPELEASLSTNKDNGVEPYITSDGELFRRNLKYAWTLAPDFPELLSRIAEVMGEFIPKMHGYVGAGVNLREANEKTTYIRGLYKLLKDEHGFEIDQPIKKAMAAVTTVMLNKSDIEVSTD